MAKPKRKAKARRARQRPIEDPRDVALRGALRQAHELREALRDVFAFYEKRRETYGVDDVLRIGRARVLAFGPDSPRGDKNESTTRVP